MRWCCFVFCCAYRFTLALLAHFNWFTSTYVNCIYFVLWKSYDLLWFWMHLILCTCFKPLRTRNYLIVWCNLIRKRITIYPNNTYEVKFLMPLEIFREFLELYFVQPIRLLFQEIYVREYEQLQKSERKQKPNKINGVEPSDEEGEEGDSSGDDQDADAVEIERMEPEELNSGNLKINSVKSSTLAVRDDEERECKKQIFMGGAMPSSSNWLRQCDHNEVLVPPPRLKKQAAKLREEKDRETCSHISMRGCWNRFNICDVIRKRLKSCKSCKYCAPCRIERYSLDGAVEMENNGAGNVSDAASQIGLTGRIRRCLPIVKNRYSSSDDIDLLTPDFTNKRDLTNAKEILLREKRDRRVLKKRLQAQKRAELAIIAKYEAKQKTISSAIELLLQILQMITSFAILVGNIRKTFIPAHFNWVKHGRNDSMMLMMLWRCTVFLDVLLFWTSVIWAYCLQCHLCCRLGLLKFWVWILMLALIGGVFVLYPMSYVQDNLDVSWCQFKPNSTLAQYQPNW
uniref:XK-related protein n=1 Tax=Elaeophora elaphi TaxID=1147741 RepID=A0A0R3RRI9_9BILA